MAISDRQSWWPPISDKPTPEEMALHSRLLYNATNDHDRAITLLKQQVDAIPISTTTTTNTTESTTGGVTEFNSETGDVIFFPSLGSVNDERGNALYMTQTSDSGAKIIVGDSSPITIKLNSGVTRPWFTVIDNDSSASASLVPVSGTLYGQQSIPSGGFGIVYFDGLNFFAGATGIPPQNTPVVAHKFLTGYSSATGAFTAAQPAFADISGIAATDQIGTGVPLAGEYVDGGTGAWTALPSGTPNFADNETPSPTPDGTNKIFTLIHSPSPAISSQGFMNGVIQDYGVDYTITGATITFTTAPPVLPSPATLIWFYRF